MGYSFPSKDLPKTLPVIRAAIAIKQIIKNYIFLIKLWCFLSKMLRLVDRAAELINLNIYLTDAVCLSNESVAVVVARVTQSAQNGVYKWNFYFSYYIFFLHTHTHTFVR